jgi:tetratricopeptide (TPR) repeat protein
MRMWKAVWLVWAAGMLLGVPAWAQAGGGTPAADSSDPRATARAEYNAGKAAADAGDFAAAHAHFTKAHQLIPTPHTQYWLAFCLDKQGKSTEAIAAYEEFLGAPDADKAGEDRVSTARARLQALQQVAAKQSEAEAAAAVPAGPAEAAPTAPQPRPVTSLRLHDLQAEINNLESKLRNSHSQLNLLSQTILSGGTGGARAQIQFLNELSDAFRVTQAMFVLDGAVQYNRRDTTGKLAAQKEIPVFSGLIPPGDHTLQVLIKLKGHGYGVFSYLRGYKFEVKSTHSFRTTGGKTMSLSVEAYEKGGVTTALEQRPALRFVEKETDGLNAPKQ